MKVISDEPQWVDIDAVIIDEAQYPRAEVDFPRVDDLVELLEAGVEFAPVVIEAETMLLVCGRHRYLAHRKAGLTTILANFVDLEGVPPILVAYDDDSAASKPMGKFDRLRVALTIAPKKPGTSINYAEIDWHESAEERENGWRAVGRAVDPEALDIEAIGARLKAPTSTVRYWFQDAIAARAKAEEELRPARILATSALLGEKNGKNYEMPTRSVAAVVGVGQPQVISDANVDTTDHLLDPPTVTRARQIIEQAPEPHRSRALEWLDAEAKKAAAEKAEADRQEQLAKEHRSKIETAKKQVARFVTCSPTVECLALGKGYSDDDVAEVVGSLGEIGQSELRRWMEAVSCLNTR